MILTTKCGFSRRAKMLVTQQAFSWGNVSSFDSLIQGRGQVHCIRALSLKNMSTLICLTQYNLIEQNTLKCNRTEVSEQCFWDRIRIRILFGFRNLAEYEYEYYSGSEKWPNTNTNTIRVKKYGRIRIRILFGFRNFAEYEYEYYSECHFCPNTNTNIQIIRIILNTNMNNTEFQYKNHPKGNKYLKF